MKNELKHINLLLSILLMWIGTSRVFAQQDPMYTQYMNNLQLVNPAYVGSADLLTVMAVSRNQWVSISGAPATQSVLAHSPIKTYNMGLGFSLLHDKVGVISQTGAYVDYSYFLDVTPTQRLALGLKGGVNFYDGGLTDLQTVDPDDPVFARDINRNFLPNFGIGALFYTDRYYVGLSVPKLIQNTINKNSTSTNAVSKEDLHVFFMGGYVFNINRFVKFKPYLLTKFVKDAPVSVDISVAFLLYDRLWLGAMFRPGDSYGAMLQVQATKQIKVGYSYDLTTSDLGAFSKGTHEVMVTYDFDFGRGRVRSPRYF